MTYFGGGLLLQSKSPVQYGLWTGLRTALDHLAHALFLALEHWNAPHWVELCEGFTHRDFWKAERHAELQKLALTDWSQCSSQPLLPVSVRFDLKMVTSTVQPSSRAERVQGTLPSGAHVPEREAFRVVLDALGSLLSTN